MFMFNIEHPFSEPIARQNGCSVVRTYCGHGINDLFHTAPNVPHYAKNKAVGTMKPGMTFTIEPVRPLRFTLFHSADSPDPARCTGTERRADLCPILSLSLFLRRGASNR